MKLARTTLAGDLPEPIVALEAKGETLVSVLQSVRHSPRGESEWSEAIVCRHDQRSARVVLARSPDRLQRVHLDERGDRLALVWRVGDRRSGIAEIEVRDSSSGALVIAKRFPGNSVFSAVPVAEGVVVGRHCQPWTSSHGPKLEVRTSDLERVVGELHVDDAGFHVEAANGVVASTGIDLHLWWPDGRRPPFSFHHSPHAPPGELGPCALSRDGRIVAVLHDRRHENEPLALVLTVDAPEAQPVKINQPERGQAASLALSPEGDFVSIRFDNSPLVRIYRSSDGVLLGEVEEPGLRAQVWSDATTLVVGGDELAAWTVG